jgi:hypothetical protein
MSFTDCKVVGVGVNPADYHAVKVERGDVAYPVSPSMLKQFAHCPSRWRAGYVAPESEAKMFGSLLDCRLLTPGQFAERYAVQPSTYKAPESAKKDAPLIDKPWSNNATVCREWNAAQRDAGKEVVSASAVAEADEARQRLLADPILAAWHEVCDTQVLVQGQWQDEATGLVVPARCLIDYAPRKGSEFETCLGDLKTAFTGALRPFEKAVYAMGYHIQAAFDLAIFNAATGEGRDRWVFVGQESYAPWQPFRRMLDEEFVQIGKQQMESYLRAYCQCLKKQEWPGYDDNDDAAQGWSVVRPAPWMAYEAVSSHMAEDASNALTMEQKLEMAGL